MNTPSEEFKYFQFKKEGQIGILTIVRPETLNALNIVLLQEFKKILLQIIDASSLFWQIEGLVITGEGEKSFIAGADISEMSLLSPEQSRDFGRLGQEVTLLLEKLNCPVIAAVNGYALGGGLEIALSCDFILATENALFGLPEVKLGLMPGFGGTQRLMRKIGEQFAKEWIFTARKINAQQALERRLVLSLYENKNKLILGALNLLQEMQKNSFQAITKVKKAMSAGRHLSVSEGLEGELEYFTSLFGTDDMVEGTMAFLEKRSPKFKNEFKNGST